MLARCKSCRRACRKNRLYCRICRPGERPSRKARQARKPRPELPTYGARDRILESMGFSSYADYLDSELWRGIRQRVLRKHPACFRCGQKAHQVHHRLYSERNLAGKNLAGLHAICGPCHRGLEFAGGRKLPLYLTVRQTKDVLKRNQKRKRAARRQPEERRYPPRGPACISCGQTARKDKEHCRSCAAKIRELVTENKIEESYSVERSPEDLRLAEQHLREIAAW